MITYGLVGYPLSHSYSKQFFLDKFRQEQIMAEFINWSIPTLEEFPAILQQHPNLRGFSVTIPHKENIIPLLHEISPEAKAIGAVNSVGVKNGVLTGYNTDVHGFQHSLQPLLKPHHQSALVLGTGGASKAICWTLEQLSITPTCVSRTPAKNQLSYEMVTPELLKTHTVIVNTTPLGMYPNNHTFPELPYAAMTDKHLLFDLTYNPEVSLFLAKGQEQGASIKNGREMLGLQAERSWELWTQ